MGIGELFGAEKEEMGGAVKPTDVTEMKPSELLTEAVNIIKCAESDDKDGYFAIEERLQKQYGHTDVIYILEFTYKLMEFVDKFTSYSKRTICLRAILSMSDKVVVAEK